VIIATAVNFLVVSPAKRSLEIARFSSSTRQTAFQLLIEVVKKLFHSLMKKLFH
jgi:hypothetical protein